MRVRWRHRLVAAVAAALLLSLTGHQAGKAAQQNQTKPAAPAKPPAPVKPKPLAPQPPPSPGATLDTGAKHALILEVETGTVLYKKYADERMPPASMSKIMTAYVVFGMLKSGQAKLTDELTVSQKAWKLGGSKMFVGVGGHITIENLVQGMLVQSGNDACVVLAEGLASTEAGFVDLMNEQATALGLKNSHFANVTGLPDPNEWMTAEDLATLAVRIIRDFPEYYHYFSEKEFNFNNIDQANRNPLLYRNIGADGLKTGHTDEAGFSLTASVVRGDRRVILVVSGLTSMKDRATESERLIEWAFREFNDYKLFSAGDKVDDAEVWLGTEPKVGLTIGSDVTITLPRRVRRDMKVKITYNGPIPAPVKKGDEIGKLIVSAPDIEPIVRPLFAASNVPAIGTFGRMATLAAYLIWGGRH